MSEDIQVKIDEYRSKTVEVKSEHFYVVMAISSVSPPSYRFRTRKDIELGFSAPAPFLRFIQNLADELNRLIGRVEKVVKKEGLTICQKS